MASDTIQLRISTPTGAAFFPLVEPDIADGCGWDSIGNDAAHDGDGAGNQKGDHTDHGVFLEAANLADAHLPAPQRYATFQELLGQRALKR